LDQHFKRICMEATPSSHIDNRHHNQKSRFLAEEICQIANVKPYVLRFWESEFEEIQPVLDSTGKKYYAFKDLKAIQIIKKLLVDEKLTIERAKLYLEKLKKFGFDKPGHKFATVNKISKPKNLGEKKTAGIGPKKGKVIPPLRSTEKREHKQLVVQQGLDDSQTQKLILAKAKLESLVGMVDALKKGKNFRESVSSSSMTQ
jgi:DNA-binding transcriptional MerR regulator